MVLEMVKTPKQGFSGKDLWAWETLVKVRLLKIVFTCKNRLQDHFL